MPRKATASGIIREDAVYTHTALAQLLGRNEDWVAERIIGGGCPHCRLGNLRLVSGRLFADWIEAGSAASDTDAEE